jgi:glycosyltransferase involved in cell wall biosynthesis
MKVALVHDFLNQWGGAERVLDALHELYPDAPVFTLMYDEERTQGHFRGWDLRTSFLQFPWIASLRKYAWPLYPLAIEFFDLSAFDLVISSSNSYAKGVITRPETLHICYCHTPTAYLWVRPHEYLGQQRLGPVTGAVTRMVAHRQRQWDRLAAERVDVWVANSKNVRERIKKFYRKESTVIYPPVDCRRFSISRKSDNYFLYVSRLSGYKNPGLVIEVFNRLRLPLILIGTGDELPRLKSLAKKNITFTGWIPDEEAAKYYRQCRALIFPVEEDFGLVPLEAMASGRPVIALKKGGAQETVIENKTGLFFEEPTETKLSAAIRHFLKIERSFDSKTIRGHSQKFDRQVFLDRIKRFVNEAWEGHRRKVKTGKPS